MPPPTNLRVFQILRVYLVTFQPLAKGFQLAGQDAFSGSYLEHNLIASYGCRRNYLPDYIRIDQIVLAQSLPFQLDG